MRSPALQNVVLASRQRPKRATGLPSMVAIAQARESKAWKSSLRNMSLEQMVWCLPNDQKWFLTFLTIGAYSWIRRTLDINMEGEQTGTPIMLPSFQCLTILSRGCVGRGGCPSEDGLPWYQVQMRYPGGVGTSNCELGRNH